MFRRIIGLFSLITLFVIGISAQSSATLSGTVTDEKDAVIVGATVTIFNTDTGFKRTIVTNNDGGFTIPFLQPATYQVTVEQNNFAPFEIKELTLNVNDVRSIRVQLKTGNVKETVQVSSGDSINISPAVTTVVDRQFVENLPLNGRSFQSLIALTPGVVRTGTEGQFSVNGQRDNANYFTIDGVSANVGTSLVNNAATGGLGQSGSGQTPGFNAVGGTSGIVSVDAMQEFRIQSSTYAAEFGRTPGGQIQIVTRSGGKDFHGTVYDYFRNDKLDATNWFVNANRLVKPPLRQNNFGGVVGGPLVYPHFGEGGPVFEKGKTFFFFSFEALRLRLPVTISNALVPSLTTRNTAPASVRPYLNSMPLPTGADTTNGAAFFSAAFSNPLTINATSFRVDHNFNSKFNLFGRFNISPSKNSVRGTSTPTTVTNSEKNVTTLTFGSTWIFSSNLINEVRGNFSKNDGKSTFTNDNFGGAVPISDALLFPSFANPATDVVDAQAALSGFAFTRGSSVDNVQRQINLVDNFTLIAGNHQLKFGADYRYLYPTGQPRSYALGLNFFSLASVMSATPDLVQVTQNDKIDVSLHNFSLYGQDTWRANNRLTLDFGLRWEYNPPPTGRNGSVLYTVDQVTNPATLLIAPAGTPLYRTVKNNFAPRFGATFKLRDKQGWETVLRGGYGVFFDLGSGNALATSATYPHQRVRFSGTGAGGTANPLPLPDSVLAVPPQVTFTPPFTNQNLLGFASDYTMPRTYQWNLAIEQGIANNQTISISYIGAAGRKLLRQSRVLPPAGTGRFLNLYVSRNSDTSDYNALQAQFVRRFTKGFQALANYTWAKSFDTSSSDLTPNNTIQVAGADQLDINGERGFSNFDVRHNFNATVSYEIPSPSKAKAVKALLGGWSLDSIFAARSGLPINVVYTRTFPLPLGSFGARPDVVAGVPFWITDANAPGGQILNTAAFAIPTTIRQGNLQRNTIHGFNFWQLDFALRRQINVIGESLKVQLKGELFNAFNHPNFTNPPSSIGTVNAAGVLTRTSTFGRSASMLSTGLSTSGFSSLYQPGGPRSVQLTLKIIF